MNDHDMLQNIHNEVHELNRKYDAQKDALHELDTKVVAGFAESKSDHKHLYDRVKESDEIHNRRLKEHGVQIDDLVQDVGSLKVKMRWMCGIAYGTALVVSPIVAVIVTKYVG